MKFLAKPVPKVPSPNAGLSFLQASLGFVLGCVLVLAIMGCLEFRRIALDATAHAEAAEFGILELQGEVATLKAWEDDLQLRLEELQKAMGVEQAAEMRAQNKNVRKITGAK
jgi:hypothetical protein